MTEKKFVLNMSIELFHNEYYCMIFRLPQSPAVFFWFYLFVFFFVIVVFFLEPVITQVPVQSIK